MFFIAKSIKPKAIKNSFYKNFRQLSYPRVVFLTITFFLLFTKSHLAFAGSKSSSIPLATPPLIKSDFVIEAMGFYQAGNFAASDGAIIHYYKKTGDERVLGDINEITDRSKRITQLTISDNGATILIMTAERAAYLYDLKDDSKACLTLPPDGSLRSIVFHKSSYEFLLTMGGREIFQNIELLTGGDSIIKTRARLKKKILMISKLPSADKLLAATDDNYVNLIDTRNYKILSRHKWKPAVTGAWASGGKVYTGLDYKRMTALFMDDGIHYILQNNKNSFSIYSSAGKNSRRAIRTFSTKSEITALTASHKTLLVAAATSDGLITIFDPTKKGHAAKVLEISLPDVYPLLSRKEKKAFPPDCALTLAYSFSDNILAIGTSHGFLYMCDTATMSSSDQRSEKDED